MRQMKYVLQITVLISFFVMSVIVLLQAYNLYIRGYQELGSMINHSSIVCIEQDCDEGLEK